MGNSHLYLILAEFTKVKTVSKFKSNSKISFIGWMFVTWMFFLWNNIAIYETILRKSSGIMFNKSLFIVTCHKWIWFAGGPPGRVLSWTQKIWSFESNSLNARAEIYCLNHLEEAETIHGLLTTAAMGSKPWSKSQDDQIIAFFY